MKKLGLILIAISVILAVAALSMDVSVMTSYGNRVNNIGLMNDRQNYLLIAAALFIGGIIFAVFGDKGKKHNIACPFCAEQINKNAVKCRHCGSNLTDVSGAQSVHAKKMLACDFTELNAKKELVLNDLAISDFACRLYDNMKGHTPLSIILSNQDDINRIKEGMPGEMVRQFEVKLEDMLKRLRENK